MSAWEYKIVPAPNKGVKARGIKGADNRFAYALEILMNDMADEGWEFQRAETLPSIERAGLTGTTTEWRNVMVFRRGRADDTEDFEHELLPAPDPAHDLAPTFEPETAVEAAPDPSIAAATLQKRDVDVAPEVKLSEAEGTDEFEHVKAPGGQKPNKRQGRGQRRRNQAGKNKKTQDTAQDLSTNDSEPLAHTEPATTVTSEDESVSTKPISSQTITEKTED